MVAGGRDKHASGFFEAENQRPKKGIKDDKMSVWSWWSIDRTYVPRQQLLRYISYIQTLCLISVLHSFAQTMFFPCETRTGVFIFLCVCVHLCHRFIWIKNNVQWAIWTPIVWQRSCNHRLVVALKSDNDHLKWRTAACSWLPLLLLQLLLPPLLLHRPVKTTGSHFLSVAVV